VESLDEAEFLAPPPRLLDDDVDEDDPRWKDVRTATTSDDE
jgi:hypothetical protein